MVQIGIVGLGFMAATHIRAYRQVDGARVAAICNPSGRHLDGDFTGVAGNVGATDAVKLDLTGARPVPGGAVLDVLVCWGGVDIKVPDTWGVQNQATVMLGGVEDRSKVPPADARDMLIIRGLVIMGGIEIKN